jgi:hypothetical protein
MTIRGIYHSYNIKSAIKIWESDTDDGFACFGAHTNYEVIVPGIQTFSEERQPHNEPLRWGNFLSPKEILLNADHDRECVGVRERVCMLQKGSRLLHFRAKMDGLGHELLESQHYKMTYGKWVVSAFCAEGTFRRLHRFLL